MSAVAKLAYSVQQGLTKHRSEFDEVFAPLKLKSYMRANLVQQVTGFEIVQFDTDLDVSEDKSTSDFIKEKYGERAEQLIRELLDYPKVA